MLRLTEDAAKRWLRDNDISVPRGCVAASGIEAQHAAEAFERGAVVKALVPAGRRGKAGAVLLVKDAHDCRYAAEKLLGTIVNGHTVHRVYIEERVAFVDEYYLSFVLQGDAPQVLVSRSGGVDIEKVLRETPSQLVRARIDPLDGLDTWTATELWLQAGVYGAALPNIAAVTAKLYQALRRGDALLLEVNPLAIDEAGAAHIVGAMIGIDPNALFRHPEWRTEDTLPENPRERAVAIANRELPGGECQYVELDGDIGLLVGGGGAGLYQHDLMLELGGKPANHCVTPPTGADNRKLKAVLSAILENPKLRGLLIGFNFAQMARTDIRVRTLVELLDEKKVDTAQLPIVIRLFGAGEADSRAMLMGRKNIHYVPRGTTLKDAVRLIVQLTTTQSAVGRA